MEASEIHARRLNAKEVFMPKNGENSKIPNRRWNSQIVRERPWCPKIHSNADQLARSEDLREDRQGNSKKSQPTDETEDDGEARNAFWSVEGDFICRHHVGPRQFY